MRSTFKVGSPLERSNATARTEDDDEGSFGEMSKIVNGIQIDGDLASSRALQRRCGGNLRKLAGCCSNKWLVRRVLMGVDGVIRVELSTRQHGKPRCGRETRWYLRLATHVRTIVDLLRKVCENPCLIRSRGGAVIV